VGTKSDVWSLGCLVHQCLFDRKAFGEGMTQDAYAGSRDWEKARWGVRLGGGWDEEGGGGGGRAAGARAGGAAGAGAGDEGWGGPPPPVDPLAVAGGVGGPPAPGAGAMTLPDDPSAARRVSVEARRFLARCFTWDAEERPSARELLRDPWLLGAVAAGPAGGGAGGAGGRGRTRGRGGGRGRAAAGAGR